MGISFTPWLLPGLVGGALACLTGAIAWRHRGGPGSRELLVLSAGVAWWCLFQAVILTLPSLEGKVLASQLQYLGVCTVPLAWFWFALGYTGRSASIPRSWWLLLAAPEVASLLLAWTNGWHGLVWREIALRPMGSFDALQIDYGPWFRAHVYYAYGLIVLGTGVLVATLGHSPQHRRRLLAVVLASLTPLAANLLYLVGLSAPLPIDVTPAGFALSAVTLGWALLRNDLLDQPPVPRARIVESIGAGIVVLDRNGRVVDLNAAASSLLGLGVGAWLAEPFAPSAESASEAVSTPINVEHDGRILEVSRSPTPHVPGGGTVMLVRDVTEQHLLERELFHTNQELARLASTDALTGLANRRQLHDSLDQEIRRMDRYRHPLSVLLLDIDHFKEINDTLGHATGDGILQGVADKIRAGVRESDIVGRLGGDELAVVLPETDAAGAQITAERILNLVAAHHFPSPSGMPLRVTVSIGVTVAEGRSIEPDQLLQTADTALYQAKASGRNQVRTIIATRDQEVLDRIDRS